MPVCGMRYAVCGNESQEAKSEVLSISAICSRACHSRSSDVEYSVRGSTCRKKVNATNKDNEANLQHDNDKL